jgi:fatty acid desaturase
VLLLCVLFLGGRQLGLAVLMHEAGHKTLFRSAWLNELLGQWLAAFPVLGDCNAYGASHREHHRLAGTDEDPDLPNYAAYPISVASFRRKLLRDLTGQTGLKLLAGTFRGAGNRIMMREGDRSASLPQGITANALLLGILWLGGAA